jgi:1,4-dihydroxy-2-naphthoate octaprenyltransferase
VTSVSRYRSARSVAWALAGMSRPDQLGLIALVYAMGSAIALARGATLDLTNAGAGLVAVLLVSASVHYANEYADYFADYLAERTPFSGGSGALQRTGLPRRLALYGAIATFLVGAGVAVGCLLHGYPIAALVVLLVIAVFGWAYSVGPALAWRGLGELDNALLGGIALPAYGFAVQAGSVTPAVVLVCVPFFALVFVNLLDTTWVDREADGAVGKNTLATRLAPSRLRVLYLLGVAVWLVSLLALRGSLLPDAVVLASLLVAPLVVWGALWYTRRRTPFPTVAAMVLTAVAQTAAWLWVAT